MFTWVAEVVDAIQADLHLGVAAHRGRVAMSPQCCAEQPDSRVALRRMLCVRPVGMTELKQGTGGGGRWHEHEHRRRNLGMLARRKMCFQKNYFSCAISLRHPSEYALFKPTIASGSDLLLRCACRPCVSAAHLAALDAWCQTCMLPCFFLGGLSDTRKTYAGYAQ